MKRARVHFKDVNPQVAGYGCSFGKQDIIELIDDKILFLNHQPAFFYYQNKLIPTLKYLQQHPLLKTATIDMGAIKFIVNGADVMRPGLIEINPAIQKEEPIVIIDQNNKKPIAVGIALYDGTEIQSMATGKVIRNIHYVGDELWKME